MNLAILQPIYKYINSSSYIANLVFYSSCVTNGIRPLPVICDRTFIQEARGQIAKTVVKHFDDIDLCLWLDSDHQFEFKDLTALLERMNKNKLDILSGSYLKRCDQEETICAMVKQDDGYHWLKEGKGLYEVDIIGLGFCLMKPEVIKHMWQKYKADLFNITCSDKENLVYQGEDVQFCKLLKEEGYKIFLDMDILIGHHGFNRFPKTMIIK